MEFGIRHPQLACGIHSHFWPQCTILGNLNTASPTPFPPLLSLPSLNHSLVHSSSNLPSFHWLSNFQIKCVTDQINANCSITCALCILLSYTTSNCYEAGWAQRNQTPTCKPRTGWGHLWKPPLRNPWRACLEDMLSWLPWSNRKSNYTKQS